MNNLTQLITVLSASIDALRSTIPANTEIVLHDLTQPKTSVVCLLNGHVSGRKLGDGLLAGPENDVGFTGLLKLSKPEPIRVFENYSTFTTTGKALKSASTIYYDEDGNALCAFCVNVDVDAVNRLKLDLEYLAQPIADPVKKEEYAASVIDHPLDELLATFRKTGAESNVEFRKRVVSEINDRGFFKIKGSVNRVAQALGVTRFTIYNYLEKL